MGDPRDTVELGGRGVTGASGQGEPGGPVPSTGGRPFLRLWFECSGQYARASKTPDGRGYLGRCPKCGAAARFPVGEGGTSERFFKVSCR